MAVQTVVSRRRTALDVVQTSITTVLTAALIAASLAQVVRDRTPWLAWLMYLPLGPLALNAALWDLLRSGRALPRRWLLLAMATMVGGLAISLLWQPAREPESGRGTPVRLVHWNTQWGGARGRETTRAMLERVAAQRPDIVCLSEAPSYSDVRAVWNRIRSGAQYATSTNGPWHRYHYRMTVISRYPVELAEEWDLDEGHAALFELATPHPLRVLMVDIKSSPRVPRSPSLEQVGAFLRRRAKEPVDVVVGDFNTPGRFLGFDAIAHAGEGYERTALWSGAWRATWPSGFPLFDIDHVWVRSNIAVRSSEFFRHRATDHRGQLTVVNLP